MTKAVNEDVDAQFADEVSRIKTEKLFIGPESTRIFLPKATYGMATQDIRNAWPAVDCYASVPKSRPIKRSERLTVAPRRLPRQYVQLVSRVRPAIEQPSFALSIKGPPIPMGNPEEFHVNTLSGNA